MRYRKASENYMSFFNCITPCQLIFVAAVVTVIISDGQSADDLNIWGNFIVAVGSLMLTVAAKLQTDASNAQKKDEQDSLQKQIDALQKKLGQIEDCR